MSVVLMAEKNFAGFDENRTLTLIRGTESPSYDFDFSHSHSRQMAVQLVHENRMLDMFRDAIESTLDQTFPAT